MNQFLILLIPVAFAAGYITGVKTAWKRALEFAAQYCREFVVTYQMQQSISENIEKAEQRHRRFNYENN